jgi:tetratricopeptide (TPR) repeat protein
MVQGKIMYSLKRFPLSLFFLLFSFSVIMAQTTHVELFERAKYTMETKGDLQGAIQQFEEIIVQYPTEKEYAAKSQFYIGLCYEKLGYEQAKKAFEKVIDNYPAETEVVNLAKEKLSVINASQEKAEVRNTDFQMQQVWAEPLDDMGMPSPDGRYISFVN